MNYPFRKHIGPKTLVLADQAILSGGSFLTNVLIARNMGPVVYGQYSILLLAQLFILSLQQAGVTGIYQVIFPKMAEVERKEYSTALFYIHLFFSGILFSACLIFLFLFPSFVQPVKEIFIAGAIGIVLFLLQDFLRKLLLTQKKFKRALWIDSINNVSQIVILLMSFSYGRVTLEQVCWIIDVTFLIPCALGIFWIKPQAFVWNKIKACMYNHGTKAKWLLCSALLQWGAGNFFILAAGWWLGTASLAALRLSQYIFGLLNVILQAIENYAIPIASSVDTSNGQLIRYAKAVSKKSFMLMGPLLLLVVIFAKSILGLLGGEAFISYYYIIYYLALTYVLVIATIPLKIVLRVRLLNRAFFNGYALTVLFSVASAYLLITWWHLKGVAFGLIFSQVVLITYWLIVLTNKKQHDAYYSPGIR